MIANKIAEVCKKHSITIIAWNLLPDHVHMLIAANDLLQLRAHVKKIKGGSSYAFALHKEWESPSKVWAQKFHHKQILDESQLMEMMAYIKNNHLKHADIWPLEDHDGQLNRIIEEACTPLDEILRSD
ncbi:MAG: hypothetical protein HND51_14860 [Chloroflexi bacterium]|nr:hypothetical protein [Chloroflexota bacterium]